jgi:hypothetical protein
LGGRGPTSRIVRGWRRCGSGATSRRGGICEGRAGHYGHHRRQCKGWKRQK